MGTATHKSTLLLQKSLYIAKKVVSGNIQDVNNDETLNFSTPVGNNINWLLGHIVYARHLLRNELALPDDMEKQIFLKNYADGTNPRAKMPVFPFNEIIKRYEKDTAELEEWISNTDINKTEKCFIEFVRFMIHEAYHAGQIAALRWSQGKRGLIM
jgi:hypothetical protein